jgi:hypothetical protein
MNLLFQIRIYDWMWAGNRWNEAKENFDVCLSTQVSKTTLKHFRYSFKSVINVQNVGLDGSNSLDPRSC